MPPLLPSPEGAQRTFLTPPEWRTISPASGFAVGKTVIDDTHRLSGTWVRSC